MADSQKWNSVILLCFLWGWPSNQDNPNWFINVTLKYWIDIPNSQTIFWNISAQDILISLPIPHLLTFSSHSNLDNFIMSLLKYSLGLYVSVDQNQNIFQPPPWFFLTHLIIPITTFVFGTQEDILMWIICDSFLYWFDCRKWPHKIEVSDFFFID